MNRERRSVAIGLSLSMCAAIIVGAWVHARATGVDGSIQQIKGHDRLLNPSRLSLAPAGRLVYVADAPGEPGHAWSHFLVSRTTGRAAQNSNKDAAYPVLPNMAGDIFGCQFSPDGRYVLLKNGWVWSSNGTFKMYLWDLQKGQLYQRPIADIHYDMVLWSPDSEHLAYVQGGDAVGEETPGTDPVRLYTYSLKTGQSHLIVQDPYSKYFTWTNQRTLLYTARRQANGSPGMTGDSAPTKRGASTSTEADSLPGIYEVPADGGAAKEVIRGASEPMPSPDGQWIGFRAWHQAPVSEDPEDSTPIPPSRSYGSRNRRPQVTRLTLPFRSDDFFFYNRLTGTRSHVAFRPGERAWIWAPDSQHIFYIDSTYRTFPGPEPPNLGPDLSARTSKAGEGTGHVQLVDVPSLRKHEIATLIAQDVRALSDPTSNFHLNKVSKNGKFLLVDVLELGQLHKEDNSRDGYLSRYAVNLKTGSVTTMWKFLNSMGYDWYETPTP